MKKLAIISTHPIQYYAPLFELMAKEKDFFEVKIFYTCSQKQKNIYDQKFKKIINWDIPLLKGYNYTFVENQSKSPGTHHFMGIKCPSLIQEIKDWEASHLFIIGWNFHAHLKAMIYFKNKIPVWFRGDSHLLDEKPGIKKIMRRVFLKWVYTHIDKAFYVGTNNKNYYTKHGLKENQLIFAPHAIDNQRFSAPGNLLESKALTWRKELKIQDNDFVILFCGKLEPKKNPLLLLEAFIELQNQGEKHLKLIFVGSGELEMQLKKKAQNNPDVYFLSFQNQTKMPLVYRLANLYCLPSQGPGETWGLAVNEAMACGRPVIVSNKVGCGPDLINAETGLIFESNNRQALTNAIKKVRSKQYNSKIIQKFISEWSYQKIIRAIKKNL